ncbi:uncharacterized protein LOC125177939 [Hyalella azteca]|uniref:Uncharacterized protein LOC125177939 n=1 Tax=Hyalella azteca TaxID=294128 RepID=A0A979FI42_HYAAZ|nr:uncharacterized protein LOC125177939 [Hyalella azteca]
MAQQVPRLRPFVTAYLRQHEELINTSSPASVAADSTSTKSKASEVSDSASSSAQGAGRIPNSLREAILKRLPIPRGRASSDSCVEASTRRQGKDLPPSTSGTSSSSDDIRKSDVDSGIFSSHGDSVKCQDVPVPPKHDRIIEKDLGPPLIAEPDGSLCFSGTPDSNVMSKVSNSTSHYSSTNSSTRDSSNKTQSSSNSCLSCCSKISAELSHDKKSPVIHVKLYSTSQSLDGSVSRRHSHVLCHKVPLSSLSCCSECMIEENGDVAPCLCTSQISGYSVDSDISGDKKSTCSSSIHSNIVCNCAEEISCVCTKGSQITCEVDLVFEGENVKNVPMKNEIMEVDVSNSLSLVNNGEFGEHSDSELSSN